MPSSLIRFECPCGKRLSAPAKAAGRNGQCPRCGQKITVPSSSTRPAGEKPLGRTTASTKSREPLPSKHPQLDVFYKALVEKFGDQIDDHHVVDGKPTLRFLVPEDRRQTIQLDVADDAHHHTWLLITSEIGTVTTFEETTTALRLNRNIPAGRIYLDDYQIMHLEHRLLLDETDAGHVIQAVEDVAHWADEFEEQLFAIDVR